MTNRKKSKHMPSNYQMNLSFLKKYNTENETSLSENLLKDIARRFYSWEEKHVFCHESSYEYFRENVIWLDYDEILEMCIEHIAHPSEKPPWQTNANYAYFKNKILPQMNSLE